MEYKFSFPTEYLKRTILNGIFASLLLYGCLGLVKDGNSLGLLVTGFFYVAYVDYIFSAFFRKRERIVNERERTWAEIDVTNLIREECEDLLSFLIIGFIYSRFFVEKWSNEKDFMTIIYTGKWNQTIVFVLASFALSCLTRSVIGLIVLIGYFKIYKGILKKFFGSEFTANYMKDLRNDIFPWFFPIDTNNNVLTKPPTYQIIIIFALEEIFWLTILSPMILIGTNLMNHGLMNGGMAFYVYSAIQYYELKTQNNTLEKTVMLAMGSLLLMSLFGTLQGCMMMMDKSSKLLIKDNSVNCNLSYNEGVQSFASGLLFCINNGFFFASFCGFGMQFFIGLLKWSMNLPIMVPREFPWNEIDPYLEEIEQEIAEL